MTWLCSPQTPFLKGGVFVLFSLRQVYRDEQVQDPGEMLCFHGDGGCVRPQEISLSLMCKAKYVRNRRAAQEATVDAMMLCCPLTAGLPAAR